MMINDGSTMVFHLCFTSSWFSMARRQRPSGERSHDMSNLSIPRAQQPSGERPGGATSFEQLLLTIFEALGVLNDQDFAQSNAVIRSPS